MVVLNFYGKIKPVCISQKLRLFLSNLPDNAKDDWKSGLVEELAFSAKVDAMLRDKNDENTTGNGVIELYKAVFPGEKLPEEFSKEDYFKLADIGPNTAVFTRFRAISGVYPQIALAIV